MKKHNFSAGPCILPNEVFKKASKSILNFDGIDLSILEISHRSNEFVNVMNESRSMVLHLLDLNENEYTSLFLQGGASLQFLMIAYNFLESKAGYVDTGSWSTKAMKEARLFGDVIEIASSKEKKFNYIPKDYKISNDLDYAHITTNNTIYGTQFHQIPKSPCPLFSDMSSDIFSRNLNFKEFDLIYAGAQKNIGPAGATLVVIKKEILESICRKVPSMLNYKIHFDKDSMFNTPPVFSVYACMLSLKWLEKKGGIEVVENLNRKKSEILYNEIDCDDVFSGFADIDDRSMMNVTFNLNDEKYKDIFDKMLVENNISGLNGHRSVGGYRASIYNAMDISSVEVLIDTIKKFKNYI
tara:strand:- start:4746 stop:5810 length:1065 start_codon:yes stop_codon:yes gene_type:complete